MSLLAGSVAASRFRVAAAPAEIDFELRPFYAIAPGSEVRESIGFTPFAGAAEYRTAGGWAFRVRRDVLRPDPTLVKELLAQLVATEAEQSPEGFVSAKTRRMLKNLAEEQLIVDAAPRSSIVECAIIGEVLWIGSASDAVIGRVLELLRAIEVVAEPIDDQTTAPAFVESLIADRELPVELVEGSAKLSRDGSTATLRGEIASNLVAMLDAGYQIDRARLSTGDTVFTFDATRWRVSGLRLEHSTLGHWSERLDQRLEWLGEVFAAIGERFAKFSGGGNG